MAKLKAMPVVVGAAALTGGYLLYRQIQAKSPDRPGGVSSIFSPDFSFLSDLYTGSTGTMQDAFNALAGAFSTQGDLFGDILTNARDTAADFSPFDDMETWIQEQKDGMTNWWDEKIADAEELIDDVTSIPENLADKAAGAVTGAIDNAKTKAASAITKATGGLSPVRTLAVTTAGWGAVGVASGTAPPFIPFFVAGGFAAWLGAKLRQLGIRQNIPGGYTVVAPETAIVNVVKKAAGGVATVAKAATSRVKNITSAGSQYSAGSAPPTIISSHVPPPANPTSESLMTGTSTGSHIIITPWGPVPP